MKSRQFAVALVFVVCILPASAAAYPTPVEGDYVIKNFRFKSGEVLPELRLHYRTIGVPVRDATGRVRNAVLIMHGTGGSGPAFLNDGFAGVLFEPGQLLDGTKHFIILPDGIGHGKSSKPSDGMRARNALAAGGLEALPRGIIRSIEMILAADWGQRGLSPLSPKSA